jgi:GAF domain-containing protein
MFDLPELDYSDRDSFYEDLVLAAKGLVAGESNLIANCANLSALLFDSLPDVNWVGFYLVEDGELVVGPFQGKPACIRIAMGEGVCGTAAAKGETVIVDDVEQFPGHIACDSASRSEIVLPLRQKGKLRGVLDIDAPIPSRFDKRDGAGLERVLSILD